MEHEKNCGCITCQNLRKVLAQQDRAMQERGWYAHAVMADSQSPTGFNYHTHGFRQTLGHMDVQIVLPMTQEKCHSIAGTIYDRIKVGANFAAGESVDGIIENFKVSFIKVQEGGRDVLRVILPGRNGEVEPTKLSDDEEPEYSLQWNTV